MKKTFKSQDVSFFLNTKTNKKSLASPQSRQNDQVVQTNNQGGQRQVKVVCPNCQFHFKIVPKLIEDQQIVLNLSRKKQQDNLQKLIEKQYSLISSFSRSGQFIENSPVVKLKRSPTIKEDVVFDDLKGLERLQKLNQINQMQKSRLEASRITVRFRPSPNNSPPDEHQQQSLQISRIVDRKFQQSPEIKLFHRQPQPTPTKLQLNVNKSSGLHTSQRQLIEQTIFDYYQATQALSATIEWVISNEHYKQLPSYLKLLIDQFLRKRNLKD